MKGLKVIRIAFECFIFLGFYWVLFGVAMNPIQEYRLLKQGITKLGVVEHIEGLDSNKNESAMFFNPYHYTFTTKKGEVFKNSQLVFISLKEIPETAKPKFSANITYLENNPDVSAFTSTIASSFGDFLFRRVLLALVFVSILYVPIRFIIIAQFKRDRTDMDDEIAIERYA